MPKTYSGSQMLSRTSALIAAVLLGLALLMRLEGEALELRPGAVLFAGLGFALLAALVWGATLIMRRLETDRSDLGESYDALLDTAPGGIIVSDQALSAPMLGPVTAPPGVPPDRYFLYERR